MVLNIQDNIAEFSLTICFDTIIKRGVFQGDPLSPIIFLIVFIELSKNDCGFNLNGEKIITLPYVDDFCLITTDLRKHQQVQNEIKSKIESMEMRLKPAKFRSFSIRSGVPSRVNFTICETWQTSISYW